MKLYREGDRSAGVCESCKARVATRMEYRDYRPEGWDVTVPGVLVAACEACGEVVAIPHQSTPWINSHRKEKFPRAAMTPVGARLHREDADALDLATVSLGRPPGEIMPPMMRFYFSEVASNPGVARAVKERAALPTRGVADRRVNFRVDPELLARVLKVSKSAGMGKSDLIRGIARLAAEDAGVDTGDRADDRESRGRLEFLRRLALTV